MPDFNKTKGPTAPPPGALTGTLTGTLTLRDVCNALVNDGEISQDSAERILSANLGAASNQAAKRHPLELVAIAALRSEKSGKTLDVDRLTQWLAGWAGQPYYHIDPLKI